MTTSQQNDVVDDIITDHREVEEVFKQIEQSNDPKERRDLVEHVIAELVRHSVGEEQYVYPRLVASWTTATRSPITNSRKTPRPKRRRSRSRRPTPISNSTSWWTS